MWRCQKGSQGHGGFGPRAQGDKDNCKGDKGARSAICSCVLDAPPHSDFVHWNEYYMENAVKEEKRIAALQKNIISKDNHLHNASFIAIQIPETNISDPSRFQPLWHHLTQMAQEVNEKTNTSMSIPFYQVPLLPNFLNPYRMTLSIQWKKWLNLFPSANPSSRQSYWLLMISAFLHVTHYRYISYQAESMSIEWRELETPLTDPRSLTHVILLTRKELSTEENIFTKFKKISTQNETFFVGLDSYRYKCSNMNKYSLNNRCWHSKMEPSQMAKMREKLSGLSKKDLLNLFKMGESENKWATSRNQLPSKKEKDREYLSLLHKLPLYGFFLYVVVEEKDDVINRVNILLVNRLIPTMSHLESMLHMSISGPANMFLPVQTSKEGVGKWFCRWCDTEFNLQKKTRKEKVDKKEKKFSTSEEKKEESISTPLSSGEKKEDDVTPVVPTDGDNIPPRQPDTTPQEELKPSGGRRKWKRRNYL